MSAVSLLNKTLCKQELDNRNCKEDEHMDHMYNSTLEKLFLFVCVCTTRKLHLEPQQDKLSCKNHNRLSFKQFVEAPQIQGRIFRLWMTSDTYRRQP